MKKLLNIDGGGVRIYFSLLILQYIEKITNKKIIDIFDYFSGVSASSIILSAILTKYSVDEIIIKFKDISHTIFYRSFYHIITSGFGFLDSKYTDYYINKELEEMFKEIKLNEVKKPLSIMTYDLNTCKPVCFYSKKDNYELWKIIRGSIAAPTYFNSFTLDNYNLVDGGVVANNLSELTFVDALKEYGIKEEYIQLSIGTGSTKLNKNICESNNGEGILFWSNSIIDVLCKASSNYEMIILDKLKKVNNLDFNRLDIELNQEIKLDDYTAFDTMDIIFNEWIEKNSEYINDICKKL
jgi:patatin-like phospholipase/acyl hydrolase